MDAIVDMYGEEAVFVSPNPPMISDEFSTRVEGRDALRRCMEGVFAPMAPGTGFTTLEVLAGVDSAVVISKLGRSVGVDTLLYDSEGLISTHYDTSHFDLHSAEP